MTTPNRQKIIPDVPTAQEVGYQNIEMVVGWSAVYGLPDCSRRHFKMDRHITKDEKDSWNKMTKGLGNIVDVRSPADTKAYVELATTPTTKPYRKWGLRIE